MTRRCRARSRKAASMRSVRRHSSPSASPGCGVSSWVCSSRPRAGKGSDLVTCTRAMGRACRMESQESTNQNETEGDESPQEFAEQVENDPSTAQTGEDEVEEVRGG